MSSSENTEKVESQENTQQKQVQLTEQDTKNTQNIPQKDNGVSNEKQNETSLEQQLAIDKKQQNLLIQQQKEEQNQELIKQISGSGVQIESQNQLKEQNQDSESNNEDEENDSSDIQNQENYYEKKGYKNYEDYLEKTEQEKRDFEEGKKITKTFLNNLIKKKFREYYTTPRLNPVLHLNFKGFHQISALDEFTGLVSLYLEGNAISKIEGLEKCTKLKQLCLHQNCITKIDNLEKLQDLMILNLSDNFILKIENLQENKNLETLQLKGNKIGIGGISDLDHIIDMPALKTLDLSDNKIDSTDILEKVIIKTQIQVLYLTRSPFIKKFKQYRKTFIFSIPTLKYLDELPIFPEERKYAEAFKEGGLELERQVRKQHKEDEAKKRLEYLEQSKHYIEKIKKRYSKDLEERKKNDPNYLKKFNPRHDQIQENQQQQQADQNNSTQNVNNIEQLQDDQPPPLEQQSELNITQTTFNSAQYTNNQASEMETYVTDTTQQSILGQNNDLDELD